MALVSWGIWAEIEDAKDAVMAGRIVIDTERCKGCGLCIAVCPKHNIVVSQESNRSGYFPAECGNGACTACQRCAMVCPEGIIEILWEEADRIQIVATGGKQSVPHPIEEKA